MASLVPTCVWPVSAELIAALDRHFGDPLDAYVNGAQVWLRNDGPDELMIEWRLHPVAGYRRPDGWATDEVFAAVARPLALGVEAPVGPGELWDGLEAFAAYGEEIEPATLAATTSQALGITPAASGLADHARIGDEWERTGGQVSVIAALLDQLGAGPA